jgi:hypothetical protein
MTPTACPSFLRHPLTRRHASLDFSLLLPPDWRLDVPAPQAPADTSAWVELARARSAAADGGEPARLVVSGCARTTACSLEDALAALLRRQSLAAAPATLRPLTLGRHAGLSATLRARHRGRPLGLRVALLEDGGRLLRLVLSRTGRAPRAGRLDLVRGRWRPGTGRAARRATSRCGRRPPTGGRGRRPPSRPATWTKPKPS